MHTWAWAEARREALWRAESQREAGCACGAAEEPARNERRSAAAGVRMGAEYKIKKFGAAGLTFVLSVFAFPAIYRDSESLLFCVFYS